MPKPRWSVIFFMSIIVGVASALVVGRPPVVIGGNARTVVPPPPATDLLAGTFSSAGVSMTLDDEGDAFSGTIRKGTAVYPFTARPETGTDGRTRLIGRFQSNGRPFAFSAAKDGDMLVLTTDQVEYRLRPAGNPLAEPAPVQYSDATR